MRHGFSSGHWYDMGYGAGGMMFLFILLVIAIIALIAFLSGYFMKKNHPEHGRLLELLKAKYVKNEISADEYRERSMLLDDEDLMDVNDPAMAILKERYAKCEISSREYVERRDELKGRKNQSALEILKVRYARGEISSEEFLKMKNDIQ